MYVFRQIYCDSCGGVFVIFIFWCKIAFFGLCFVCSVYFCYSLDDLEFQTIQKRKHSLYAVDNITFKILKKKLSTQSQRYVMIDSTFVVLSCDSCIFQSIVHQKKMDVKENLDE